MADNRMNSHIFSIKSIPDFLEDHAFLSDDPRQRLVQHCEKLESFIAGLWTDKQEVVYQLRFRYIKKEGKVKIYLTLRFSDGVDDDIIVNVRKSLQSLGVEISDAARPVVSDVSFFKGVYVIRQSEEALTLLKPFETSSSTSTNMTCEDWLERYENIDVAPEAIFRKSISSTSSNRKYLILPWYGPGGCFERLFESFSAYGNDAEVSICLKPTALSHEEKRFLEHYSGRAATAASHNDGFAIDGSDDQDNFSDPVARRLEQVTFDNLTRLAGQPFLAAVYALASDKATAAGIARTIASQIDSEVPFASNDKRSRSDFHLYTGSDFDEFLDKYDSFDFYYAPSSFNAEIQSLYAANPKLGDFLTKRYRFMVDAKGAATVFRFPVSVKSGVKGLNVRQRAPDFVPYDRKPELASPAENREDAKKNSQILLGRFESGGYCAVNVDDFRRHALITGFTGSGKTQTALNLLRQFWINFDIPFLVIESAKQEYRGFLGYEKIPNEIPAEILSDYDDESRKKQAKGKHRLLLEEANRWKAKDKLQIYTLGNSTVSPFFLNPFEIQKGVRVETHISRLTTCFEAALPQFHVLPSVMGEALEDVYRKFGWALTDTGRSKEYAPVFPTLNDVETTLLDVIEKRGYVGEFGANFPAAVKSRISMLKFGSVGHMLNCRQSSSLDKIFKRPTILELNDLNEQDKSLITMFLLVFLREYREENPDFEKLIHVTMVEEAHNILEKTGERRDSETGSDSKARAVKSFCNMLTEMRAVGEGMIIADQSPNKLADDVMRNTNVQIVHQLRDFNDRESVANAMIMTKEQRDFVGKLRPGRAALFYTGLERTTFIQTDVYYNGGEPLECRNNPFCIASDFKGGMREFDSLVHEHMASENEQTSIRPRRWDECELCQDFGRMCEGRFWALRATDFFSDDGIAQLINTLCLPITEPSDPQDKKKEEQRKIAVNEALGAVFLAVDGVFKTIPIEYRKNISHWCFLRSFLSKTLQIPICIKAWEFLSKFEREYERLLEK